jgi:hypothetical protein
MDGSCYSVECSCKGPFTILSGPILAKDGVDAEAAAVQPTLPKRGDYSVVGLYLEQQPCMICTISSRSTPYRRRCQRWRREGEGEREKWMLFILGAGSESLQTHPCLPGPLIQRLSSPTPWCLDNDRQDLGNSASVRNPHGLFSSWSIATMVIRRMGKLRPLPSASLQPNSSAQVPSQIRARTPGT